MAHALDHQQLGVRDDLGRSLAAGRVHQRVDGAVDDERGDVDLGQARGAAARGEDGGELAGGAGRVVAAVPRLAGGAPQAGLVEEAGASLAALEGLKALGVRIAIDDFGTGYSSLSYLSRLPIDVLKIDRSFIADIGTSRQAAALVRSIVKIGQTLHLETIAEGVETEEQVDRLVRLGAKLGQGYLFARPLAAGDLATLLLAAGSDAA